MALYYAEHSRSAAVAEERSSDGAKKRRISLNHRNRKGRQLLAGASGFGVLFIFLLVKCQTGRLFSSVLFPRHLSDVLSPKHGLVGFRVQ